MGTDAGNGRRTVDITERTFKFGVRIVKLARFVERRWGTADLGRQVLRSGTSIGANVEEAQAGQSKADFISKMQIALKEARETDYWLRLLVASETIRPARAESLQAEAREIAAILGAIVVSARRNAARPNDLPK